MYSRGNEDPIVSCPICMEALRTPIMLCQTGHSMCQECITAFELTTCPTCNEPITKARNIQLEEMLEGLKSIRRLSCCYSDRGCRFILSPNKKEAHEKECRFRTYVCEGHKFAGWECDWSGPYLDVFQHFQDAHCDKSRMKYTMDTNQKIDLTKDSYDLHMISFFSGQYFFYYKHKVDTAKQKAYWTFQMIGLQEIAESHIYEFEIYSGHVRQFKVMDVCDNDTVDTEAIFEQEKCVAIAFPTIRSFLNKDGELSFRFRIKTLKKNMEGFPFRRSFDGVSCRRSTEFPNHLSFRSHKSE